MLSYTYLLINLLSIVVPVAFSFDKRLNFNKNFQAVFIAIFLVAVPFIVWDIFFTKIGVWGFTEKYLTEINLLGLPLEEILFFICIPYACIFTHEVVKYFFPNGIPEKISHVITKILAILSFVILILSLGKFYSSWTFALFLASILYLRKEKFLNNFYLSSIFIFPAFFLVNGVLTGICFNEPVVWYNNSENLGIRFFSIPYDDFFYGFLLLVWNVYLYEKLKK